MGNRAFAHFANDTADPGPNCSIVGASVAILIAGLILSPPGRATGGHMNPAISLAMWRFGVFPGAGVVPYIIAQLLGSVLGVLVARAALGSSGGRTAGGLRRVTTRTRVVGRGHCSSRRP